MGRHTLPDAPKPRFQAASQKADNEGGHGHGFADDFVVEKLHRLFRAGGGQRVEHGVEVLPQVQCLAHGDGVVGFVEQAVEAAGGYPFVDEFAGEVGPGVGAAGLVGVLPVVQREVGDGIAGGGDEHALFAQGGEAGGEVVVPLRVEARVEAELDDGDGRVGDEVFEHRPHAVVDAARRVGLRAEQFADAFGGGGAAGGGVFGLLQFARESGKIVQGGGLRGGGYARAFADPVGRNAQHGFDFAFVFAQQFVADVAPFFGVGGAAHGVERVAVADEQYGQFHGLSPSGVRGGMIGFALGRRNIAGQLFGRTRQIVRGTFVFSLWRETRFLPTSGRCQAFSARKRLL